MANGHVYPQVDVEKGAVTYLERPLLFRNVGDGKFKEEGRERGLGQPRAGRGLALGDLDGDGRLDFVIGNLDDKPQVFLADGKATGGFLMLALVGTTGNRDAIGARVTLEAGGRTQVKVRTSGASYLSAGDPRLHFGLGGAAKIDRLEVRFPGGARQEMRDVPANSFVRVSETTGLEVLGTAAR
jgi:hypothetical protein